MFVMTPSDFMRTLSKGIPAHAAVWLLTIFAFVPGIHGAESANQVTDVGRISVSQVRIARFAGDRAAAISYTFDDGLRDQFAAAVPMLNEFGFKGTFFIIPGKVAETTADAEQRKNDKRAWGTITWDELKNMDAQGHEIASHTWSHPNLTKLSPAEVEAELGKAGDAIKTHIGKPPLTLAFPFNASTPEIREVALKHYLACRTYQTGTDGKATAASLDAWADQRVKERKWGVLMIHAITNGYAAMTSTEVLHDHWKYVQDLGSNIWVDTFANIARYEKERDAARISIASSSRGKAVIFLDSSLDSSVYNVPLTIVVAIPGIISAHAESAGGNLPVRVLADCLQIDCVPAKETINVTWQ